MARKSPAKEIPATTTRRTRRITAKDLETTDTSVTAEAAAETSVESVEPKTAGRRRRRASELLEAVPAADSEATEEGVKKPKRAPRTKEPATSAQASAEQSDSEEAPKTRRSRKTPVKKKPPVELAVEAEPDVQEAPKNVARQSSRRTVSKTTQRAESKATESTGSRLADFDPDDSAMADLPVPRWRSVEEGTTQSRDTEDKEKEEASDRPSGRRSRGRKRMDEVQEPVSAAEALDLPSVRSESRGRRERDRRDRISPREVKPEPTAKPEPVTPTRAAVPIPSDAPQVIVREGVPQLVLNRDLLPPLCFFASVPGEKQLGNVLDQIDSAAEHGVRLISLLTELEIDPKRVDQAVQFAGYLLKELQAKRPEVKVIFRTVFAAPAGWERRFEKARFVRHSGGVAEPSVSDDDFWGVADECLASFVRKLRVVDTNRQVIGLHLERGEWFLREDEGYDTSPAAYRAFREWLRLRYRNDVVALRAAWFDGSVDFANAQIPEFHADTQSGDEFVRTDRRSRRFVDYHLFLSDVTVQRIADLAYTVKLASDGYFLAGVSYGYTFEWSHPASGHLSLGKLLRCRDVDYIAGPPSYRDREPGGAAAFPCPVDSLALNGKLYLSEEDFKTPISGQPEPDDFNPIMKTPQALESVHWRGVGSALAHGAGVCWMDSWGNGWLNSKGIWDRGSKVIDALTRSAAQPQASADVAVFIDERSLGYLVDQRAFRVLVQNVREAVLRSGLSVAFYLLSDLAHRENFPESKLHVFVNAWDMRPEVRSAIKTRLQRDGKVLFWLYAAGLFEGGRESLERVREVTGIALRPQPFFSRPGTTLLNARNPLCEALPDDQIAAGGELEPSYFAIPEEDALRDGKMQVLGEYTATGLPSFMLRTFEGEDASPWTSVFLGEPVVSPELFRALGQLAGAHVYNFANDVVHVRSPWLTIHCASSGPRTLTLPDKWVAYDLVRKEWPAMDGSNLRFPAMEGMTHSFAIGLRSEIESMLATDPSELLTVDEIPEREQDTLDWEQVMFDVSIMKLDEWVEESWSEAVADDLLLRPSLIEAENQSAAEATETGIERGRRRRRKRSRSRGDSGGDRESTGRSGSRGAAVESGPTEINVIFRKRE